MPTSRRSADSPASRGQGTTEAILAELEAECRAAVLRVQWAIEDANEQVGDELEGLRPAVANELAARVKALRHALFAWEHLLRCASGR